MLKELKNISLYKYYLLVAVQLLAGNYLHANDSLNIAKKKLSYFNYVEFFAGINMNQASVGLRYYEINYRKTFRADINLVAYRNLDLNFSANYIKKSIIGAPFNEARKLFFLGKIASEDYYPNREDCDFDIVYCSFDLRLKYTFLKRKKLQPFFEFGIRENILVSSGYNTINYGTEIDEYIQPNLKKQYVNFLYGVGVNLVLKKLNSLIIAEIEINNDWDYFTEWKYGRATYLPKAFEDFYGGKFRCIFFRFGYRYYLR
jgi:hypothetical protein